MRLLLVCAAASLVTACSSGKVPSNGDVKNALNTVADDIGTFGSGVTPIQIQAYHDGARRTKVLGCKPDDSAQSATGLYAICDLSDPSDGDTDTFQLKREGDVWAFTDETQVAQWETDVGASPE